MKRLPAEWEHQRFVQLTWPHADTDWAPMMDEVNACFVKLALSIVRFEPLLIVCKDAVAVHQLLSSHVANADSKVDNHRLQSKEVYAREASMPNTFIFLEGMYPVRFVELLSNDTWARDHGGITVLENGKRLIFDYAFNGWGQKFEAGLDNALTRRLFELGMLSERTVESGAEGIGSNDVEKCAEDKVINTGSNDVEKCVEDKVMNTGSNDVEKCAEGMVMNTGSNDVEKCAEGIVEYCDCLDFVLEGGSLESDGNGTLLTTSECLLSAHRNPSYTKEMIEQRLKADFGLSKVLWLNHGYLEGDDTDSHIDTLARFCDRETIAYVHCDDPVDAHFEALQEMADELRKFRTFAGKPYRLIPLPMADVAYDEEGNRLPATYANFLIVNGAVLMPIYGSDIKDKLAHNQLQLAFPNRQIVGVDCKVLIQQHGSLHCVTMQYH